MGFVSGNVSAVLSLKASTLIVAGTRLGILCCPQVGSCCSFAFVNLTQKFSQTYIASYPGAACRG